MRQSPPLAILGHQQVPKDKYLEMCKNEVLHQQKDMSRDSDSLKHSFLGALDMQQLGVGDTSPLQWPFLSLLKLLRK